MGGGGTIMKDTVSAQMITMKGSARISIALLSTTGSDSPKGRERTCLAGG